MDEIDALSKSASSEGRLKAISLYEERFSRLPSGRSRDFIREQMASSDAAVSKKAKEVFERTVKPSEQQMSERWNSLAGQFGKAVQMFGKTVKESNDLLFSRIARTASGQQFASNAEEISEQVERKEPKDEPYVGEAAKLVAKQGNVDWNIDGYKLLVTLEIVIRRLIADRLLYCDQATPLRNSIPKEIYDKCLERMKYERQSLLVESSQDWLDYLDFSDLAMIIEKGRNRGKIVGHLDGVKQEMVISKLRELEPIRNKLSHSRFLSEKEFQKLSFQAEDLFKLLLATEEKPTPVENPYAT
ncbi:MAG TPA: hypothetical protein VMS79_00750 [Methanomassiliicoccales archaeon]|nr:hypothetical protein [Methanomassiliicoccales archaeon]